MKKATLLTLALAALLLASACGGMKRPAVEKRYYGVEPVRAETTQAGSGTLVLKLRRLQVSPLNAGRELVYKTNDTGYTSDYYHTYFVPPADMLSQSLRKWLHRSGLFTHVVEPASLVTAQLSLEGMVNALYGDYTGGAQAAVAEMQFFLMDERTGDNAVLFSQDYEARIPLADQSPQALASGLKQACTEIFTALEADLGSALTGVE